MTSLEILAACDADEQIFERGSNFTYEEFAQLANVRWQERVKQFRQALDERSHLLDVLAVYREDEEKLNAEIKRLKRAGAILARFAWDHADDTEDKHLEVAELFREEWRAMLAETGKEALSCGTRYPT